MKNALGHFHRLGLVAAIAAFSGEAIAATNPPAPKTITLAPAKVFEKCMTLTPPQKLVYEFDSSDKIKFNIHYHKGESAYYPVKVDRTNRQADIFDPQQRNDFCLMWENRTGKDVSLTYSYRITK